MTDTKTTLTWLLRDEVSATARKIDGTLKGAAKTAGGAKAPFNALGAAIGSMINPTTLAIAGIGALAAGTVLAIDKAKNHEVVVTKLTAALKEHGKGYMGTRQQLDAYIEKQTELGFNVDDTTNAMAQLIAATNDVGRAQTYLAAAQDLARLKGISLEDASQALIKVEGGRFRLLAGLGITLQKGATATQALAAVQKAAAGQAAAYGGTFQGQMDKMNAKFDAAMEKVGKALLPVLTHLAGFFADVLIPAIEKVIGVIATLVGWIISAVHWFQQLFSSGKAATSLYDSAKNAIPGATFKPGTPGTASTFTNPSGYPGRAAGGPVTAGGVYMVGEHGPEMLLMGRGNGYVVPNAGMSPVEIPVIIDGQQVARIVDRRLYMIGLTSGTSLSRS